MAAAALAIGFAYVQRHPELLWVSAAGAAAFLLTEAYRRANQRVFVVRIREIEDARQVPAAGAAGGAGPAPATARSSPDISNSWMRLWGTESLQVDAGHVVRATLRMRTYLPHGLIIVAALALLRLVPRSAHRAG